MWKRGDEAAKFFVENKKKKKKESVAEKEKEEWRSQDISGDIKGKSKKGKVCF